jgi:hypothetical protein
MRRKRRKPQFQPESAAQKQFSYISPTRKRHSDKLCTLTLKTMDGTSVTQRHKPWKTIQQLEDDVLHQAQRGASAKATFFMAGQEHPVRPTATVQSIGTDELFLFVREKEVADYLATYLEHDMKESLLHEGNEGNEGNEGTPKSTDQRHVPTVSVKAINPRCVQEDIEPPKPSNDSESDSESESEGSTFRSVLKQSVHTPKVTDRLYAADFEIKKGRLAETLSIQFQVTSVMYAGDFLICEVVERSGDAIFKPTLFQIMLLDDEFFAYEGSPELPTDANEVENNWLAKGWIRLAAAEYFPPPASMIRKHFYSQVHEIFHTAERLKQTRLDMKTD